MLPLEGLTVVSLEQAVAAPLCTRHLADHGARVIKIERPGAGDFARGYDETVHGLSSHFVWLNRGKESVTLDLKHAEAREALSKLVAAAIGLVGKDRTVHARQMHANLMRSACARLDANKRITPKAFDHFVMGDCRHSLSGDARRTPTAVTTIGHQRQVDRPARRLDGPLHDRQVSPFDGVCPEQRLERSQGLG